MSLSDVFLSFRGNYDSRTSFTTRTLYDALERNTESRLFYDQHEQSKDAVVAEDHYLPSLPIQLLKAINEESEFNNIIVFSTSYASSKWCLDELVNIIIHVQIKGHQWRKSAASNKEFSLTSTTKHGFGYSKNDNSDKVQTWREAALVEAVSHANFIARDRTTVVPHPLFCCYMDYFQSNLQKQKWGSRKPAAVSNATLKILNLLNAEDTGFPLTYSSRQFQLCNDTSLHASEVLPTRNLWAGESMNVKLHSLDTIFKLSDGPVCKKRDMKTKITDEAPPDPPDPFRDSISLITARNISTSAALLMTIFVLSTFLAAVSFSSSTFKEDYLNSKDTITSRSIVAINSFVFIVSLVTDMFLLRKFTYKWELQIVLFALFGAYICIMKATIPQAAFPLFVISFPFLLIAAVGDAWVNDACSFLPV